MTNEFQGRQNIEMSNLPGADIFCRAARRASHNQQPALTEIDLKRMAKEFTDITQTTDCPEDGAIVAEAFSNHVGPMLTVVREIIDDVLKIGSYTNQIGVGFVGSEFPFPMLSFHTAPHMGVMGSVPPVTFSDNFLPLGEISESAEASGVPHETHPLKIVGSTPAGSLMVKGIRTVLEKYAASIGGFVLEEPLGVENLPSFLVVNLVKTDLGYCAHRLNVSFELDVAKMVSTNPSAACVVPFVKKD